MTSSRKRLLFGMLTLALFAAVCGGLLFYACAPIESDVEVAYAEELSLIGNGTQGSPYLISNARDLAVMSELVNNDVGNYRTAYYQITNNAHIDLNDLDGQSLLFSPIGTVSKPFAGVFEGKGSLIYNIEFTNISTTCTAPSSYIGLFGVTNSSARISGVGISNGEYADNNGSRIGGIVGQNAGRVDQCFFEGKIEGSQYIGGIVGYNLGDITRCFSNGTLTASNYYAYNGGITGYNYGNKVRNSYTQCKVVSSNGSGAVAMGGVSGTIQGPSNRPNYCYYNASVNPALSAVGIDVGSVEVSDTNNMKGFTSVALDSASVNDLFELGDANFWTKKFKRDDSSGYIGPLLKSFEDVHDEIALASAVMVRMYGVNRSATAEWGTQTNPYRIENKAQLANLANAVNENGETYARKYFLLSADITVGEFTPIGLYVNDVTRNKAFGGTFDGGNHTLRGVNISKEAPENNYLGLFGYVNRDAYICNLKLSSDCIVSGGNYVGSLIGYAESAHVENVESRATVSASGNSGGIVGFAERGEYRCILSAVKFIAPESSYSMYGFVGMSHNVPTVISSVWYISPDFVNGVPNRFRTSNNLGAVMQFETAYGSVTASKNDEGTITFTAVPASGRETQYRKVTEEIVANSDVWSAPQWGGIYNGVTLYARFVKSITVSVSGATVESDVVSSFRELSDKYYVGQKYRLEIILADSYFIASVSGGTAEGVFSYESQTSKIVYADTARDGTNSLTIHVQKIYYDATRFTYDHTYNADPVVFDKSWLGAPPSGYRTEIVYYGGSAPSKASSEPYSLTAVMYNAAGVRVGSRIITYRILPTNITINSTLLPNQKEWDDSDRPLLGEVPQEAITGVYFNKGDRVQIEVSYTFSTRNIGTGANITYTFALSGADAGNYNVPATITSLGTGTITQRNVYFYPVSLTKEYDGTIAHFSRLDVVGEIKDNKVTPEFKFEPVVQNGEDYVADSLRVNGAVGSYLVTIQSIDDSEHYIPYFGTGAEDKCTSIIYTINPRVVNVVYEIGGQNVETANVSYTGASIAMRVYYLNTVTNKQVSLSYRIYKGTDVVSEVKNAGEYRMEVVGFADTNYSLSNPVSDTFDILKANQQEIIPVIYKGANVLEGNVTFGDDITFSYVGGTVIPASNGITYDIISGEGSIKTSDRSFVATKAGDFAVKVTLKGDVNYNDVSATVEFTVEKAALEISFSTDIFEAMYLDQLTPSYKYKASELKYGDTAPQGLEGVKITIVGEGVNENYNPSQNYKVGTYSLSMDVSEAKSYGYNLVLGDDLITATLNISKRSVVVKAAAASSEYGKPDSPITFTVDDSAVRDGMIKGTLDREEGADVGTYAITLGTLCDESVNPDFDISLLDDENKAVYSITPAKLTLKVNKQTKSYGAADPTVTFEVEGLAYEDTVDIIGLTADISRVPGETLGSYAYGLKVNGNGIKHVSSNYNTEVEFVPSVLTIETCVPTAKDAATANINAKAALGTILVPVTVFYGANETIEVEGTAEWVNAELVPDFVSTQTVSCRAKFIPADTNYAETEFDVDVTVIPKEIRVVFQGSATVTYIGKNQPDTECTFTGIEEGDELNVTLTYEGDRCNVGSYNVSVAISNFNYKLTGNTSRKITINKAPLNVSFVDREVTVLEGDKANFHYYYTGFMGDDDVSVFITRPSVIIPSTPGVYTVTPSGASADNYDITYGSLKLIVNRSVIYAENSDVMLGGDFAPDLKVELEKVDASTENINEKFATLKSAYRVLAQKSIGDVYAISFSQGEESYEYKENIIISIDIGDKYSDSDKVSFAAVTYDGDIIYVEEATIYGNKAVLKLKNVEYIIVASSEGAISGSQLNYLYIGIAAGAVVIVLVIIIAVRIKRKRNARYIKYHDDEY